MADRAKEIAQQGESRATKFSRLSLTPRAHRRKERTDFGHPNLHLHTHTCTQYINIFK